MRGAAAGAALATRCRRSTGDELTRLSTAQAEATDGERLSAGPHAPEAARCRHPPRQTPATHRDGLGGGGLGGDLGLGPALGLGLDLRLGLGLGLRLGRRRRLLLLQGGRPLAPLASLAPLAPRLLELLLLGDEDERRRGLWRGGGRELERRRGRRRIREGARGGQRGADARRAQQRRGGGEGLALHRRGEVTGGLRGRHWLDDLLAQAARELVHARLDLVVRRDEGEGFGDELVEALLQHEGPPERPPLRRGREGVAAQMGPGRVQGVARWAEGARMPPNTGRGSPPSAARDHACISHPTPTPTPLHSRGPSGARRRAC